MGPTTPPTKPRIRAQLEPTSSANPANSASSAAPVNPPKNPTLPNPNTSSGQSKIIDVGSDLGIAANVEYERAIGEAFSLRAEFGGSLFDNSKGLSYAGEAAGEFVYRFDVLKYVPYIMGGGGAIYSGGGPLPGSFDAVVVLGGGLDILKSREFSYGFEAKMAASANTTTISAGFRATWRWGYF